MNKSLLPASVAILLALTATSRTIAQGPSGQVFVTNSNDSGAGSFRAAVEQANADPTITRIHFLGGVTIVGLQSTVEFTGSQNLTIDGNDATLDGSDLVLVDPAFRATGGGALAVARLTVRDAPAEGIAVEVPGGATGTVSLALFRVDVIDNAGHGVLVNDQVDPSAPEGVQPDERGSAATVDVTVIESRFIHNGYSVSDRDGLRVNEGGAGDLIITVKNSLAHDNGADGIEVDERGAGDVRVDVFNTQMTKNGRLDEADPDDGFDIDEYNDGSVIGRIFQLSANDNFEEGLDFNENNAGDLRVDLQQVEANRNGEEGIDYEEDDDFAGGGDLVSVMTHVTANGNGADGGDAGLKIREKGAGDLDVTVKNVETSNNVIGGISVREDALGHLVSSVTGATSLTNGGRGIDFDENDTGDLTAGVADSTSFDNVDVDLRADEASAGAGVFYLSNVAYATIGGNVPPTVLH
jgi:hypothetical protein